jgi:hypothetical protein
VRLADVDREPDVLELVDDGRIAERMDADADGRCLRRHVPAKDLADADLRRSLRLVLDADHPQGNEQCGVVRRARLELEQAVGRRVQGDLRLRLPDNEASLEAVLPDVASDRAGEQAGLE